MSKKQRLIYGKQQIASALEADEIIEQIFIDEQKAALFNDLIELAKAKATPFSVVKSQRLASQFGALADSGAVAIVSKIPFTSVQNLLHSLQNASSSGLLPLIIALDKVQDPGNVGTIIRTLAAAGAVGLISDNTCIIANNRLMRNASAGSIFNFPIARTFNLYQALQLAKEQNFTIAATSSHRLKPSTLLYDYKFDRPMILVLGSEEHGISPQSLQIADLLLTIPQTQAVESLNVAIAAAVITYEFVRQTKIHGKTS